MGRKRKGSVIGDIGKMFVNTIASPLEALTGTNFVDFKYTSDFGKGASKVMEPINKAIGGATAALGTAALNAVAPGAGTALSGFGQGLGQGMNQQMNPNTSVQQPPTQMSNKTRSGITSKPYGSNEMNQTKFKHGGMLKTYNAPTHENGGQMIDANANPTNNPNKAVGEIEKKETSWNGYVFSDTLGEGKKTFAQMSKEIVNRYKGKRDNLSKKTMERELSLLVQKNEAARLEKEQMEMQQMQNQFTEEQIAALQDPESGRRAKAEIFGDERYQQQGQPSEEEMMMMQQMQQQGGMPQEGMPQDMGQYRWGGNMDIPMYQYQNGGMLEVPEAPLDEYKKGGWIQKVTKSIKKRGTEGVCTGDKFGGPSCPPGSKRYNLAKTFKAMAKKEDGGFIDSFPDLNLANYEDGGMMEEYKNGGMIKRADGSYSKRGLWDNIRDNIGSGKKPTKEMLEQERKIKAQEYRDGGYVVTRSNERKGKTHKVTGPDGTVKFFGDPDLKNNPSEKAKDAFYARHKKNLEGNPHFRAYARATWRDGGMIPEYPDGGILYPDGIGLDAIANAIVPIPQYKPNLNFKPSVVPANYFSQQQIQNNPRKSLRFKTTPLEDELAYEDNPNLEEPLSAPLNQRSIFNLPQDQQYSENIPSRVMPQPSPYAKILNDAITGAANMVAQNYALPEITRGKGAIQTPQQYTADEINLPIPIPSTQERMQSVFRNMPGGMTAPSSFQLKDVEIPIPKNKSIYRDRLNEIIPVDLNFNPSMEGRTAIPFDPTSLNRPLPSEQTLPLLNVSDLKQNELPSSTTPEEDPFKLRPLEYATIGLKGAALGKSIYDALQPAEKEQLRLNREAGLVNNMMAGRNVNMAAALNEALYNRNAALASNQARSANVQRALDMQTYSNTERNAIRSKLEEQNMNNQLRMQEAQTRAELGAAEAAERIRRQNVQSMNEAARRQFGQQAFKDLANIGGELNKVQMYRDMFANKKNLFENQFRESLALIKATGGNYALFANNPDEILRKLTSGQPLTSEELDSAVKMIETAKKQKPS